MKKLIICDMSGIITRKGFINTELLKTLENLKNFDFSFCTGKGYYGGLAVLKEINIHYPFICENGSVLVTKDGKIVYNDKMDAEESVNLIKNIVKRYSFEFLAYVDLKTHKYKFLRGNKKLTEDLTQPWFYSEEIYDDVDLFLENIDINNICRITTRGLNYNVKNKDKIFENFHVVVSENEFHSICNKNINKGFGVEKISNLLNIDLNKILIIGNDMNDIDMFKLNCYLKVATGYDKPPQELINLSDKYIPLNDLPTFLKKIDNEIEM